jgi:hypothetical protein
VLICTDSPFILSLILVQAETRFVTTSATLFSIDPVSAMQVFSLVVCGLKVPLEIFASSLLLLLFVHHLILDGVFVFTSSGLLEHRVIFFLVHHLHKIDLNFQLEPCD